MVAVQHLPTECQITKLWLAQLEAQYPQVPATHIEVELRAAIACFYKTLAGSPITWDLRRLMLVLSPQPSFNDMVQVFMSLRTAVRQSALGQDAVTILRLMETLDMWIRDVVTRYDNLRQHRTEQLWHSTIQRVAQLNTLSHCVARLNVSLDLASAFSASVELARLLSGADLCALYQQEGNTLYLRAHASEATTPALAIPVADTYHMQQIIIDHKYQDALLKTTREKLAVPAIKAACCLPLQTNDITIGKLALLYFEERTFVPQELRVFEVFAGHVAQAIYNAQLFEQIAALTAANERWQIACEMHDTLLQTLITLNINLRVMQEQAQQGNWHDVQQLIATARELGQVAAQEGRDTLADLRESHGGCHAQNLVDAVQFEATAFAERAGIQPEITYAEDIYLPQNIIHHLSRLVGEALTNVQRHAQARQVWIELRTTPTQLVIAVRDDGIGFPLTRIGQKHSFGIIGMQERARFIDARVTIDSASGSGTTVYIECALDRSSLPETGALPSDLQTFSDRHTPEV